MISDRMISVLRATLVYTWVAAWGVLSAFAPALWAAEPANVAPVPRPEALEKSMALVREIYAGQFEKADTSAKKLTLVEELLGQAAETADPVDRFVLLQVARDVAALAGDTPKVFEAVDAMEAVYDVDGLEIKAGKLSVISSSAELASQYQALAEGTLALIDEAVNRDAYALAAELGDVAVDAARRARDGALVKRISRRNGEVAAMAKAYAELGSALATREQDRADPGANLAVGKYYCFLKGDWLRGIPMLASGSDPALKALAEKEVAGATSPGEQAALGDGWWRLAESASGVAREQLLAHAGSWYAKAAGGLTGLDKLKAEKRLQELAGTAEEERSRSEDREGWIRIFDGRSLAGWRADSREANWSVVNGTITAAGERSHLYYHRPLGDFEAKADVRINRLGNSGFYFRARPVRDRPFPEGYEAQIIGSAVTMKDGGRTGTLWGLVRVTDDLVRDDTWFTLHVVAVGNRITVKIDGSTVVDYSDPKASHTTGYVALQHLDSQTQVFFKEILVKPR